MKHELKQRYLLSNQNQFILPLKSGGYLDVIPTPEGFDHIAFFPKADTTNPFWITRGEWEVTGPIEGVNEEKGIVYVSLRVYLTVLLTR